MENQRDKEFVLPKNIRQMGKMGETYKIYVEDFVYTYVHRTLREEQKNPDFVAAVLLGRHFSRAGQEYIFINGAQQVEFSLNYAIDSNMHFEKQMSSSDRTCRNRKIPDRLCGSTYPETAVDHTGYEFHS